jgi:hypothetical protein
MRSSCSVVTYVLASDTAEPTYRSNRRRTGLHLARRTRGQRDDGVSRLDLPAVLACRITESGLRSSTRGVRCDHDRVEGFLPVLLTVRRGLGNPARALVCPRIQTRLHAAGATNGGAASVWPDASVARLERRHSHRVRARWAVRAADLEIAHFCLKCGVGCIAHVSSEPAAVARCARAS